LTPTVGVVWRDEVPSAGVIDELAALVGLEVVVLLAERIEVVQLGDAAVGVPPHHFEGIGCPFRPGHAFNPTARPSSRRGVFSPRRS